jgi:hypothetical protein
MVIDSVMQGSHCLHSDGEARLEEKRQMPSQRRWSDMNLVMTWALVVAIEIVTLSESMTFLIGASNGGLQQ